MSQPHYFVQFLHPGPEAQVKPGVTELSWNTGPHPRKFIHQPGACIDKDGNVSKKVLTFWGEWEAESRIIDRAGNNTDGKPTLLFEPFYRKPKSYNGLTNTDPFVFGDTFHYVTCQQFKKDRPCTLHNLQTGDVILFGSYKGAQFTLDTVLVIAGSVLIDTANYAAGIKNKKVSKVYEDVVLKTLAPQASPVCGVLPSGGCNSSCGSTGNVDIPKPQMTRLYFGATLDNPVHGMYSFSPCKPFEENNWGFSRPVITLPGVITPNQLQGHKLNPQSDIKDSVKLWDEVRQQVFGAGLCLATTLELPRLIL